MERWMIITAAVIVYALVMMFVGMRAEAGDKKSKNLEDYFLGGRSMGKLLSIGAMTSTMLSSFALLGMPGQFYRFGVGSIFLILTNGFLMMVLVFYPWVFRSRYLGQKFGFITIGDYMEKRYGSKMRTVTAAVLIAVSVPYVAIQIQGFGNISEGLTGGRVPFVVGALFLSCIMTFYIFAGGYKGVAATDAIQALLMVIALIIGGVYLCYDLAGGIPQMFQAVNQTNPDWLGLPGGTGYWSVKTCTNWLVFGFGTAMTPQVFQKFYTNKDLDSLRAPMHWHPILTTIIYTGAMLIGLAGLVAFPGLTALESDNIAMMLVAERLPIVIGLIITVGIVAGAMSTADSQYITISSLFVSDIYRHTLNRGKEVSMEKMVKLGRYFSIVLLVLGFGIAYARLDTLVGMLTTSVFPFGAQVFIPMVAGLYSRRINETGALTGMVSGFVVAFLTLFVPPFKELANVLHPLFIGAIVNVILMFVVSYSTAPPDAQTIKDCIDDVNAYVYDPTID